MLFTFATNRGFAFLHKIALPLLLTCIFGFHGIAEANDGPLPEYSTIYDPARDPFKDGEHALQMAAKTDRRVLMEVGGSWCAYCLKLDRFIAETPLVHDTLHSHFVLLKINVSEENDNRDFLAGLPETRGYPHFFIADSDGSILHSRDTIHLLQEGQYSAEKFVAFLNFWAEEKQMNAGKRPSGKSP